MKHLIKLGLSIALVFLCLFVLSRVAGVWGADDIKQFVLWASEIDPVSIVAIIVVLLIVDLFISVPTFAITMLAGYFLGALTGALIVVVGMLCCGSLGYYLSRLLGKKLLTYIYKDPAVLSSMSDAFREHGSFVIVISRAVPMLPEVCSCLAGINGMSYGRYLACFSLASVPYALLVAYAGSVSSLSRPEPALYTAIAVFSVLGLCWLLFLRRYHKSRED